MDSLFTRVLDLDMSWVVLLAILGRTYRGALAYDHLASASVTECATRHTVKATIRAAMCKAHAL